MSFLPLIAAFEQQPLIALLIMLVAYLIGSIPFGLVFTKIAGLGDIRAIGSGNIGATNVLRAGNKKLAFLTFLCDALKGVVAMLVAGLFLAPLVPIAGLMAFFGHLYPVWLKFKGGKGVATYVGVAFGLDWQLGLAFIGIWLLTAFIFRYSSLAALGALFCVPFFSLFQNDTVFSCVLSIMSVISILKHRENIKRLLQGSESKIKLKK